MSASGNVQGLGNDIADQSALNSRTSQSTSTAAVAAQSASTLAEGADHSGGGGSEDDGEYSESLLRDHPPRTLIFSSQSHRSTPGQISGSQSGANNPPIHQSNPVPVQSHAPIISQSAPLDEEEASEVMHAPHQRHRMVLNSLADEEEAPQLAVIDLSQLLREQSDEAVVVTNPLGLEPRANHSRIPHHYLVPSDTDSDSEDSDSDTVVIEDSDDEPMQVGVVAAGPHHAPSQRAPSVHLPAVASPAGSPLNAAPTQEPPPAGPAAAPATAHREQAPVGPSPTAPAATAAPSSSTAPAYESMQDFKASKITATTSKSTNDDDSEDDSQSCIICYEPWTNSGDHRLSSLRCGHLFGHSCILKWLRGASNLKCPQCNAKAKKSDIRIIYAKSLRTIDTSERDRALENLKKEKEVRRKAEIDVAQTNLKYRVAMEEVNRLKAQISAQQDKLRSSSSLQRLPGAGQSSTANDPLTDGSHAPRGQYNLDKTIQISQNGNCRVMGFDQFHSALVVSMPSPNQLFPGFGVKKVSAVDLRCTQYVPIHTAMIRGLAFNGRKDGLMLTASADKSVKMTSLASNTVVQTYNTASPVWSCAWNSTDVNYVYAGLQNGAILVYDTRQVNGEVQRLTLDNSRCPIVSLSYVPKAADQALGCSGLLTASLGGMAFWEQTSDAEFKPHLLQVDGICTSLSFNNTSRHCLASFRPNKNYIRTRHMMCELRNERKEAESLSEVTCYPVQTFYGGPTMKVLTRSVLYQSPSRPDQLFACTGDEATSSALLWDITTGNKIQQLTVNATVLDVCPFQFNRQSFLAALTEKQVKLYKWQQAR